jgi:hypothetical protein
VEEVEVVEEVEEVGAVEVVEEVEEVGVVEEVEEGAKLRGGGGRGAREWSRNRGGDGDLSTSREQCDATMEMPATRARCCCCWLHLRSCKERPRGGQPTSRRRECSRSSSSRSLATATCVTGFRF